MTVCEVTSGNIANRAPGITCTGDVSGTGGSLEMNFAPVQCDHEDTYVCECNPEASTQKITTLSISSKANIIFLFSRKAVSILFMCIVIRFYLSWKIVIGANCHSSGEYTSNVYAKSKNGKSVQAALKGLIEWTYMTWILKASLSR